MIQVLRRRFHKVCWQTWFQKLGLGQSSQSLEHQEARLRIRRGCRRAPHTMVHRVLIEWRGGASQSADSFLPAKLSPEKRDSSK